MKKSYSSPQVNVTNGVTKKDLNFKSTVVERTKPVTKTFNFYVVFLVIVFCALFLALIFRYDFVNRTIDNIPTFRGFLDLLSNSQPVSMVFETIPQELGDWGFFNFFRDFVQFNIIIVNALVWLAKSLFNILYFIFYFLRWILNV